MTHDTNPARPVPTAHILIGSGIALLVGLAGYSVAEPLPAHGFNSSLFAGGLMIVLGWVNWHTEKIDKRQAARIDGLSTTMSSEHAEMKEELARYAEQLRSWVAGNNHLLRTMSASPTVNLIELRGEMEVVAKEAVKELREGMDAISDRVDAFKHESEGRVQRAYMDGYVDGASEEPGSVRMLEPRRAQPNNS
jgi:hypothetical protein